MTERRREDGLIEGHAYSVLEVQEVHGLRFIRLRNPWGKEEWKGRWSRGSDAWKLHSHVAQDICQRGGHRLDRGQQDGSFWILFDDFAACFDSVNVCPATMPVPKASRYAKSKKRSHAPVCGRCGQPVESCWLLVRGHGTEPISAAGAPAGLGWVRLADGDLCQLCLRATSSQRRAFWQGAPSAGAESGGMAGIREVELTRRVPGIDYFPFEAGAGCSPPLKRPHCDLGPGCTRHSPAHFASYDHPWMKPGPELVLPSRSRPSPSGPKKPGRPGVHPTCRTITCLQCTPLFCCCGCMRMPGMRMAMLGNSAKKIQVDCSSLHLFEAVVHICFMLDPLSAACLARLHLPHHLRHDPKQGNPRPGSCSQART